MKNKEIMPTLQKVDCLIKHHVSGRVSFVIAKNINKLLEAEKILQETRVKLCENFANKDDSGVAKKTNDGQSFDIPADKIEAFNKDFKELLDQDCGIELDYYDQSVIDAYADSKDCKATPEQFDALSVFVKK